MEYLKIGKLVNTHALKGEVRIISDFEYKNLVFIVGKNLYIGDEKLALEITTYRKHKNYDMVTFKGYNSILDVESFKGKDIFVNKEEMNLKGIILDEELIGLKAIFNNSEIGFIKEIINNNSYKIISLGETLIPYNMNFIEEIDLAKNIVVFKNIGGLL